MSGWPGLHVRAYRDELGRTTTLTTVPESDPRRMKVLRMERLAPAVLLVLFDGVPAVVHIEEPRQGIQFGVRLEEGNGGQWRAIVPARNVATAGYVNVVGNPVATSDEARQDSGAIPARRTRRDRHDQTAREFAAATGTG